MSTWHTESGLGRGDTEASRQRPRNSSRLLAARWRLVAALGALAQAVALSARAGDDASRLADRRFHRGSDRSTHLRALV